MKTSPALSRSLWWLLLSLISAASMAYYVAGIWSGGQPPGFSDLYARWWGAHELLLHGRDPYSPAVSHEIQSVIYGAPVAPGTADDPAGIGGGFAYPVYVVFLLWPTLYTSFSTAQKVFLYFSISTTLLSVAAWMHLITMHLVKMRLLKFPRSPLTWLTVAVFILASFPAMQAIKLQNPSLLAASLISLAIFLLATDRLVPAGILLALATFKPQFMIALIPWLALWTLAGWRHRQRLAWSFLLTMIALVLASEWLVPGWIPKFLSVARAYRQYAYGHSILDVWFGSRLGDLAAAALLLAVLAACWRYRTQPAGSPEFLMAVSLLLAANVVVMPTLAPHTQLLLLPGVLCLLAYGRDLWTSSSIGRVLLVATGTLLAWPWLSTFCLAVAATRYSSTFLLRFWQVPLYTSPVLPLSVLLALAWLLRSAHAFKPTLAGNLEV